MNNNGIEITFSEEDLSDLLTGEDFNWTFNKQKIFIFNESMYPEYLEIDSTDKIYIGLTEEDISDILNGKKFNWTFDGIDFVLTNDFHS